MRPSRLVSYVEILFDPSKPPRRHRSPSPATSSSSTQSRRATSPNLSPHKKRKLDAGDVEIVNNVCSLFFFFCNWLVIIISFFAAS